MSRGFDERIGLDGFLQDYPLMSVKPTVGKHLVLAGTFSFRAKAPSGVEVSDSFSLRIEVPNSFPKELPNVWETGGRIPRRGSFHVNEDNYSLCLGSPLRLLTETVFRESSQGGRFRSLDQ